MEIFHPVENEAEEKVPSVETVPVQVTETSSSPSPSPSPSTPVPVCKKGETSDLPDLCEASDVSLDFDSSEDVSSVSRGEDLSVEAKLIRAKERRDKASQELQQSLTSKNEQATRRALAYRNQRHAKFRNNNTKIKTIHERHSILEHNRRQHVMSNIENRLNQAISRAEDNLKKRQKRARRSKRLEKAQNKKALLEFERRSALLASVGHRSERAARNVQLRLEDRLGKAREEIQHVESVSKRVKAARVLQKVIRKKLGFEDQLDGETGTGTGTEVSMTTAAVRFQNCISWRQKVVDSRLSNLESLRNLLKQMGYPTHHSEDMDNNIDITTDVTFEQLTAAITSSTSIVSAKNILYSFEPLLRTQTSNANANANTNLTNKRENNTISARTLLSVFLVVAQPEEVLAEKRGKDKCSNLLEKAAETLVRSLLKLVAGHDHNHYDYAHRRCTIQEVSSNIMMYCTLFDKWKNADFDELVDKMSKNAHQSWVAYLTSKQALIYIEEKYQNQNGQFQHVLKHKSVKKGAASHIKRVKAAMKKLLGEEQGFTVMRGAKEAAIAQIENEQLMLAIQAKIDQTMRSISDDTDTSRDADSTFSSTSTSTNTASESKPKQNKNANTNANIPESILSNSQLVHELLLMDAEDLENLLHRGSENFEHLSSVDSFMMAYKNSAAPNWIDGLITMDGIKQLMIDLRNKMKKLVSNRADLQEYFTQDQIHACNESSSYFTLVLSMADALAKSLESQHRSVSTTEWYDVAEAWRCKEYDELSIPYNFTSWKSFLVASLTFLIGKVELCQLEIANFQLLQVAPIVRAHGKEYEIQHFQGKFGEFSSVKRGENFRATWSWIKQIKRNSTEDIRVLLQESFVDEILFAEKAMDIPEVLNLDLSEIHHIREKARLAAISSSMILHACKITNTRISNLTCESMSSEAKFHKEKMDELLNSRLPYEALLKGVSESVSMFAQVVSGQQLDEVKTETIQNVTDSVLKGNDPVFLLMDKRMKNVFKFACKFTLDHTYPQTPIAMKTGRQSNLQSTERKVNGLKTQFMIGVGKEAKKLGFNVVQENLVQATYEARRVITHCIGLYQEELFNPMFDHLNKEQIEN